MTRYFLVTLACVAALAALNLIPLQGEDKPGSKKAGGDAMEEWKKLQSPGVEQNMLAKRAGTWAVTATCWKEGPEKPLTLGGTSVQVMLYDRYLQEEFTIGDGENQMNGTGYIAFDNSNKQYQAMYIGNNGTALCLMDGERDSKTGTFTFKGERTEKGLNNLVVKSRVQVTDVIDNKYVVTIYQTLGDQPEAKFLEMQYSRK